MSAEHIYQVIYEHLLEEIREGKYGIGMQLPTEKELCRKYSVSRITAKHALDMLAANGVVERAKGKGTFVIEPKAKPSDSAFTKVRGKLIAVILPDFADAFGVKLLQGIEKECAANGVNFVLRLSYGSFSAEQQVLEEMEELGVDGIMISPVSEVCYNPKLLNMILNHFPLVIIDRVMLGMDVCFVGTDNITSVKNAMNYLFELGHEQIAWISPKVAPSCPLEYRQNGFLESCIDHNIVPRRELWYNEILSVRPQQNTPENIQRDIDRLAEHLTAYPEITAVFASEYNVAWLVKRAAQSIGLNVPQDLSIICFDLPDSFSQFREFTHVQQDEDGIGRKGVQLLLQHIADDTLPNSSVTFPGLFSIGRSTAKVHADRIPAK